MVAPPTHAKDLTVLSIIIHGQLDHAHFPIYYSLHLFEIIYHINFSIYIILVFLFIYNLNSVFLFIAFDREAHSSLVGRRAQGHRQNR